MADVPTMEEVEVLAQECERQASQWEADAYDGLPNAASQHEWFTHLADTLRVLARPAPSPEPGAWRPDVVRTALARIQGAANSFMESGSYYHDQRLGSSYVNGLRAAAKIVEAAVAEFPAPPPEPRPGVAEAARAVISLHDEMCEFDGTTEGWNALTERELQALANLRAALAAPDAQGEER